MSIDFALWSPDEATFWASWITAGIALSPYQLAPGYTGMSLSTQTQQGWTPTRATGNMVQDINGNLVPERVPVPGWHANVKVHDPALITEFTWQLDQHDENGALKSIWDRTYAVMVFNLEYKDADPVTGFPAGYRNVQTGVTYADLTPGISPFRSPTNTWA